MSYAALMVHVEADSDINKHLGSHVGVAVSLAERFGAHVIGVGGWAPMSVFVAEAAREGVSPPEPHLQDMKTLLDRKGEQLRAALSGTGQTMEWRSVLDNPTDVVSREARAADLIIVGSSADRLDPFRSLDIGRLILAAGRPVLYVPPMRTALPLRRAAIAWKDTREARRAVRDALPLLQAAGSVLIVEVEEAGQEHHAQRGGDLARYLARHGIQAVTGRAPRAEVTVIDTLLHTIEMENVDLLVAGAYGHSRLGEWMFGGVTRELLRQSPICCLLSH